MLQTVHNVAVFSFPLPLRMKVSVLIFGRLGLNMFGFGIVTVLQGLVQNYGGLLATRFFLGVFETGMLLGLLSQALSMGEMC